MDSDYMEGYIMGTVVTFLITAVGAALIATGVHPGALFGFILLCLVAWVFGLALSL